MTLLLRKLCRSKIFHSCSQNQIIRCSFCSSTTITQSKLPLKPHSFVEEYLLSTLGFSPEKATSASEQLNHLKSLENPESVLSFLKSYGFEDSEIKKLIFWYPNWLCFDVETTLKPKFEGLQSLGFSGPELTQLIFSNPVILRCSFEGNVRPKIEFWRGIFGSFELMSKSLRAKHCLLNFSLEQRVLPNLEFLREFGISDERITLIVQRHPRFLTQKLVKLKELAERVEGMGIRRDSRLFVWALNTLLKISKEKFDGKLEVLKSLGWSEADFLSAFQKNPIFLTVSETMLKKKIDFLVNEAGFKPSELVQSPILLMFSLEKRLIPRYHVMQVLKSKRLNKGKYSLLTIMSYSEKMFVKNFLLFHKKDAPNCMVGTCPSTRGADILILS
ncbi:transcription termination factor MTERF15, mitochondrial-like [Dioscorea cayenensis subsp. rotundata]|uniref:Transcription termination factor MTERF15, mitochondrial-like n=1 Tax=Dioscorea cayennensis subsp. rotundata TaxID=55577 RepID=A0AB40AI83_DIOCR|nr:transcription termination factor MTERF15, mitochondrial-like [Dioscorea cayenensis subsp. rotundata]